MFHADPDIALAAKRALRAQVLARRDAIAAEARDAQSWQLIEQALALVAQRNAGSVLAYASIGSEVQTRPLLESCLRNGLRLILPRVNRGLRRLDLFAVRDLDADLEPGTWNIHEPIPARCVAVENRADIDVVIAPGAAFTPQCERLGYGGGFYDRLLAGWPHPGAFIALAFDEQIVDSVPVTATDVRMHQVLTPTRRFHASV